MFGKGSNSRSHSVGRRGNAFKGVLASKDPDTLDQAANGLDQWADKQAADSAMEAILDPNGVPAKSYAKLAETGRSEANRLRKTSWLNRQSGS